MRKSFDLHFMMFLALVSVVFTGCGGGDAPRADVSGSVTLDGEPVDGATIYFVGQDHSFTGSGVTDAAGKFSLISGAAHGNNKVYLTKIDDENFSSDPATGMDGGQFEAAGGLPDADSPVKPAEIPSLIPAQYTNLDKTPITFTVPSGGSSSADFKLTR